MYGDKCYVKKNENENNIKDSENGIANDVLFSRGFLLFLHAKLELLLLENSSIY